MRRKSTFIAKDDSQEVILQLFEVSGDSTFLFLIGTFVENGGWCDVDFSNESGIRGCQTYLSLGQIEILD